MGIVGPLDLDLAHSRASADTTHTTAHVDAGATTLECREDSRGDKGSKAEPKEGSDGLRLVAPLRGVVRSVRDLVGLSVVRVAAAVDTELSCHCDSSAEEEEGVEDVKGDHQQWVKLKVLLERRRDQVKERQHSEDCDEHVVVDE